MAKVSEAHMEARRQSIVDAAMAVFSQKGFEGATMAEVAQEAGISPGAIYRYFPSKMDLARWCFKESAEAVAEQWQRETAVAPDGLTALSMIAQSSFEDIMHPDSGVDTALMMENYAEAARPGNEAVRQAVWDEREIIVEGLAAVLRRATADGSLPPDIDPYLMAQALMAFYQGARLARLVNADVDVRGQLEQVYHLLEHARAAHHSATV